MNDTPLKKPVLRRWQFWLTALISAALLFLVLLPLGVKYSLAWWLEEQTGAEISIADIDLNLFTGKATLALLDTDGKDQEFDIGQSRIDFNWWPLTKKHLLLPEIVIADLVLDVRRETDGTLHVGGLTFPPSEPSGETPEEPASAWGIGCQKIELQNVELRYRDPDVQIRLLIDQLVLADLYSWQPEQPATLAGRFAFNDGQFTVDLSATPFATTPAASGSLQIERLPTAWAEPLLKGAGITRLASHLSSKLQVDVSLPAETMPQLKLQGELQVADLDLLLQEPPLSIKQQAFLWQGDVELVEPGQLKVAGELQGSELLLTDPSLEMSAVRLGNYLVSGLQLNGPEQLTVAEIELRQARLLQREAGNPERHLIHLETLQMQDLELTELNRLAIEKVLLAGLDTELVLTKEGQIAASQWWQDRQSTEPDQQPETKAPASVFAYRIGQIEIKEKSHLGFIDRGHEKPVELGLDNFLLKLGTLDSRAPATASELELSGDLDRYARLKVSGKVQPLLPAPGLELEGELKGLSLPQLNPYIIEVLQGRILNGQANAEFTTRLQDNQLQAEIDLVFAQLETASSRAFESGSKKPPGSLTNMPLNLIKNSNGDVELDLEIEGDLSSPEFNTTQLIQQAMLNAMGKAMTASLAPLGIQLITGVALPPGSTLLASALFDLMTKVNIPAVVFVPGESSLPESTADQLDKLEDLLEKRPKLQLRLCGMATRSDLAAIQKREMAKWKDPKQRKKTDTGKEPPARLTETEAAYVAYQDDLLEIARQRADGIKGELVEQRGADPGRLYLCDPDIDVTEEGQPRADIRL